MTAVLARSLRELCLVFVGLAGLPGTVFGQPESWEIRKEFVPREALAEQARGLLPLPFAAIEQIGRAELGSSKVPNTPADCFLERAEFQARLQLDHLVDGTAKLTIVNHAAEPVLLLLEPCALTIESAHWEDQRPLTIGRDPQGRLHCLVERGGTLHFQWHHQAETAARDATTFSLAFPSALYRVLELSAAESARLQIAGAVVEPEASFDQADGNSKWSIRLGSEPAARLTVLHGDSANHRGRLVIANEAAHYAVLPAALDVTSTLKFDVLGEPVPSLNLQIDPPLRLAAIRFNDQEIPWRFSEAPPATAATVVQCQFPAAVQGVNQQLTIEATANGQLADGKLPRIALPDAILQSASLTVEAPQWMHLAAVASGQIRPAAAAAAWSLSNDVFAFQQFGDRGQVKVTTQPLLRPLVETSLTSITIEQNQYVGQFTGNLISHGEGVFAVEALIPRHWIVDSVEAYPPEMLSERQLNPDSSGTQRLQLKLAQPLTEQRALRLNVRAHFRRSPNVRLSGENGLRMLRIAAVGEHRRLVNLRVGDPQSELKVSGDGSLRRLVVPSLSPPEQQLLADQPVGLLFDLDSVSEAFRAGASPGVPRYRGEILLQARAEAGNIEQQVSVDCSPEGTTLGSVLVRISPSPSGRVSWRLAGDDDRDLATVVEPSMAGETVYRVLLPRPVNQPVSMVGSWAAEYDGPLSLVWLPEATQQSAIVELSASGEVPQVAAEALRPLPSAEPVPASGPSPFARYSYDSGSRAALSLQHPPFHAWNGAMWIESLETTSYIAPAGNLECTAKLVVRHAGGGLLQFGLAESVTDCRQVASTGEVVLRRGSSGLFEVHLPAGDRISSIQLRYIVARDSPTGWLMTQLKVPLPQPVVPVLRRVWNAVLPPGQAINSRGSPKLRPGQTGVFSSASIDEEHDWRVLLDGPALAMQALALQNPTASYPQPASLRGWTSYSRDVVAGEAATISCFQPLSFVLYSIYAFLLAWGASSWGPPAGVRRLVVGGLILSVALALAAPYSWLLFAAGLGLVVGGLTRSRGIWRVAAPTSVSSPAFSAIRLLAPLLFAALFAGANQTWADPPELPRRVGRVVVPVDEQQRIAGDYVYLDPALFAALREPGNKTDARPAWLLERVEYELLPSPQGTDASVQRIAAAIALHTFAPATTIEIPLDRKLASLVQGGSLLDGSPAPLRWSSAGHQLLVDVAEPGKHLLNLQFATRSVAASDDDQGSQLMFPPAAIAVVRRHDQQTFVRSGETLASHLGSIHAAPPSEAKTAIKQLSLWNIKPASAILETQFQLARTGLPIDKLAFVVDPRLQLLADETAELVESVLPDAKHADRLTVYFQQPSEQLSVRLRWQWIGCEGSGKLILPRVTALGGDGQPELVAFAMDTALKLGRITPRGRAVSVQPFRDAWPAAAAEISEALEHPAQPTRLQVDIEPVRKLPTAQQSLEWSLSRTHARVDCRIELSNIADSCSQHEVTLPPSLAVTSVAADHTGTPVKIRWVQTKTGQVTIRLLEPPQTSQTLTLRAEATLPRNATEYVLPRVAVKSATVTGSRIRLFRQPDVQLTVTTDAAWQSEAKPLAAPFVPGKGRQVMQLATADNPSRSQPTVHLQPNLPRVSGQLITRVEHSNGDWTCQLTANLVVEEGLLDQIRVLVPKAWLDDLQVEPSMEFTLEPTTTDDQQILKLEPAAPLTGKVDFRLKGPLLFLGGGIQVPDLHLLDAERIDRRVELQRSGEDVAVSWEISGLAPVVANERPSSAADKSPSSSAAFVAYRVTGPQFRALARYLPDLNSSAEILLLDIHSQLTAPNRCVSTTRALIKPTAQATLSFELPPNSRLLEVSIDGRPVAQRQVGLRLWQLPAPSDILPFEMLLVIEQTTDDSPRRQSQNLAAPRFPGLKRGPILWTLRSAEGDLAGLNLSAGQAAGSSQPCPPVEAETRRLEAYRVALDAVQAARSATVPKQVLAERAERFEKRAWAVDRRLNDQRLGEAAAPPASEVEVRRQVALEGIAGFHQRLFQAGILASETPPRGSVTDHGSPLEGDVTLLVFSDVLPVELPLNRSESSPSTWLIPLGVALGVIASGFLLHFPVSRLWLSHHRNAVLAVGGLAWWLLAPLGWLGYLAVLLATWLTVRKLLADRRSSNPPLSSATTLDLS